MKPIICNFFPPDTDFNSSFVTYEAGEACSFGVTAVSYSTSPVSSKITMGDGVDIVAIQEEEASYYLAAMKTGDNNGGAYCIHNASIARVLTLYTNGSASGTGSGGEHLFTSNSIGNWTTIDFYSGVSRMPNIPGFYYQEEGTIEATTANISVPDPEGIYATLNGTFIDLCQALDQYSCQAIETAPNTNSAAAKNFMLTSAMFIASVFFFV